MYARRRNRLVSNKCQQVGLWSTRHCERVIAWRGHICRPANASSWAAILYEHKGFQWLIERRLDQNSDPLAGRTGTRSKPGRVNTRWHDGVRYAESVIKGKNK